MESLRPQVNLTQHLNAIVGISPAVIRMRNFAKKASASDKTVLLTGETGVGKDHLARYIGHLRKEDGPFVQIDCGLFPPDLMETELFGHVIGAFTGASRPKIGLVEKADNGTLFLNEIGNLPLSLQGKLLRFMESREYRKVGGTEDLSVNVRFIAGTNANLRQEVAQKKMRSDLYYRICTIEFEVPPLRERTDDIPVLTQHFLELEGSNRQFSEAALKLMQGYSWPGNVRELRSVIDKILFQHAENTGPIAPDEARPFLQDLTEVHPTPVNALTPQEIALDEIQQTEGRFPTKKEWSETYYRLLIQEAGGNMHRAAKIAGVARGSIYRNLEILGLSSGIRRQRGRPPHEDA
jgi:DNA-binding NtrC family response regulator